MTTGEFASSPCQMHETDPAYHGFLTDAELVEFLSYILRMKKTAITLCADAQCSMLAELHRAILRKIGRGKNNSYQTIQECLQRIERKQPGPAVKAINNFHFIESPDIQLLYLLRIQHLVVQTIQGKLARITRPDVQRALQETVEECQLAITHLTPVMQAFNLHPEDKVKAIDSISNTINEHLCSPMPKSSHPQVL